MARTLPIALAVLLAAAAAPARAHDVEARLPALEAGQRLTLDPRRAWHACGADAALPPHLAIVCPIAACVESEPEAEPGEAAAARGGAREGQTADTAEPAHILGAKLILQQIWEQHREDGRGIGVGVFYERPLVEGLLEIEVSLSVLRVFVEETRGVIYPLDARFKMSFEPSERVTAYFGVGPALSIEHLEGETKVRGGVSAVVGAYWWVRDVWGIDTEVDYNVLFGPLRTHELSLGLGVVYRL